MPPNYQDPALYEVVRKIVNDVLAAGPLPPPADPNPTIDGPNGGDSGQLIGPFTIGANATGDVTVTVTGAEAFTDAAGTQPFTSGSSLPPGGQLWLSSVTAGTAVIKAVGPVLADIGTLMLGDPSVNVQSMMLAEPLTLNGKSDKQVSIAPGEPPRISSEVSARLIEAGQSVSDTFHIAGLTGPGTVNVTLYGPVPPAAGEGCTGVDWSDVGSLPVAEVFDPVAVTGDSSIDTPGALLDEPGCYSFGATLDPAIGESVDFPPAAETETLRVLPKLIPPPLAVTTHASSNVTSVGTSVSDQVTVSGLLPGRSMTITSTLYGPLPPAADGTCSGIDWQAPDLPVAARLAPFTVDTNGTFETPSVRLTRPGCYAFDTVVTHDQVTGGEEPVGHGLGLPEEVVLVGAASIPGSRVHHGRAHAAEGRPRVAKSLNNTDSRESVSIRSRGSARSLGRTTSSAPRRMRHRH